jgi:hypothetical protein
MRLFKERRTDNPLIGWEYRCLLIGRYPSEEKAGYTWIPGDFMFLGEEGWELVCVCAPGVAYFKRSYKVSKKDVQLKEV